MLLSSTKQNMDVAAGVLDDVTADWGLTISVAKTKLLIAGVM